MMPGAGGTHRWLAQVASGVSQVLTPQKCFAFLRRCCDLHVAHRCVPDREIVAAVELAYSSGSQISDLKGQINYGRRALEWPDPNTEVIQRVFETVQPVFDGETPLRQGYAGQASTGIRPEEVLPTLFRPGELVCTGADSDRAAVRPVEAVLRDADALQFICVNPMKGSLAMNHAGRPSARCQNNVKVRRYLVAEFDDASLSKFQQSQLATALGDMAPLVMAVDSGGKSVHAWYAVEAMSRQDQARFFAVACLLGADQTRWDICGWLRMPGGMRLKQDGNRVRQRILYWNGLNRLNESSFAMASEGGPEGLERMDLDATATQPA
jgi:hypothetical protein